MARAAMVEAIEESGNLSSFDRSFLADRVSFVLSAHEMVCMQGIAWLDEEAAALIDELAVYAEHCDQETHVAWSRSQSEALTIMVDAESLCRAEMEAHDFGCRIERVSEHCYRIRSDTTLR